VLLGVDDSSLVADNHTHLVAVPTAVPWGVRSRSAGTVVRRTAVSEKPGTDRHVSLPDATVEVEPDRPESSVETPLEDAAEQSAEVMSDERIAGPREVPLDVDPADLADQSREVIDDDEEYR
jgi:hypothetical protein